MSFIWKWIWLTGCCPASYFYFLFFFCGMESEVMTVRDAQERAVGSSVRECWCIRSGPGIRMLMEIGKW